MPAIVSAQAIGASKNDIQITPVGEAPSFTVPAVFLREGCQCQACFHPTTLQRLVDNVDPSIFPAAVEVATTDGVSVVKITWPDGHLTDLSASWFVSHVRGSFNTDGGSVKGYSSGRSSSSVDDEVVSSWTSKWMHEHLASELTFSFDEVCDRGPAAYAWAAALQRFGLTRLTGAQHRTGELQRLSKALHVPLRTTVYDEGATPTFQVQAKAAANNQAYTTAALSLHTDLPFYRRPPEVQLLHCVSPGVAGHGGASLFADGLRASQVLTPGDRSCLASQPVVFEDIDPDPGSPPHLDSSSAKGGGSTATAAAAAAVGLVGGAHSHQQRTRLPRYHLEATHAVLEEAPGGSVSVHLNHGVRASVMTLVGKSAAAAASRSMTNSRSSSSVADVDEASGGVCPSTDDNDDESSDTASSASTAQQRRHYAAVAAFRKALGDETFAMNAGAGNVWVFDNRRVLHGRQAISSPSTAPAPPPPTSSPVTVVAPIAVAPAPAEVAAVRMEGITTDVAAGGAQVPPVPFPPPPRHLEGAYMEWDDLRSLCRVIQTHAGGVMSCG